MLTPQDIMDRLGELIAEKFPGEEIYWNMTPQGFDRPSTLIALGKYTGKAGFSSGDVLLEPVISLTTFSPVNDYHQSELRELNHRLMVLTGLLLPGYVKVGKRAPKVEALELEGGVDYATVSAKFSYTLARAEFEALDPIPTAEHLNITFKAEER
jgi:hypothetical protein